MTVRYVLHVGQTKAGSTSLQAFLELNRSRLLEHGFLFAPGFRHVRQHSYIRNALREGDDQAVADFISATETAAISAGAHTIVLSGETLIDVPPRPLRRLGGLIGGDVQVILYVRNYVERLISRLTQQQKTGAALLEGEAISQLFAKTPNPSEQVAKFELVFGEASVYVRSYAAARASGVEKDFCATAGIPWHEDYGLSAPANRTPDALTAKVLNNLQHEFGLAVDLRPVVDDGSRCYRLPRLLEGYITRMAPTLERLDLSHPKLLPLENELLRSPAIDSSDRPPLDDYLDDLIATLTRLRVALAGREQPREATPPADEEATTG